jgi:septum formation inhibitor MinC
VTAIRRECEREQRPPLSNVTRLEINNDRRQLVADRAELGNVSAQIIDIEQARAERAAREQVSGAASAGMEAFKARFQQSQDVAGRIEAERARLTAEVQRVAQERAAEQVAKEHQEPAKTAPKHAALSNDGPVKSGRSGPDFSM